MTAERTFAWRDELPTLSVSRLELLEADVDPDNARPLRLLERLGFRREGLLRERWQLPGGPRDGVMLGLLRREFDPRGRPADLE